MKVTSIEEVKDLSSIKVDKLIDSLKTFEMSIHERSEKTNKGITFVSNIEGDQGDKEESVSDDIALLGKKVQQILKVATMMNNLNNMYYVIILLCNMYCNNTIV